MEVGAVKQAFNNEVILLKKKLNQAKIQVIHKLTRKAKTMTQKKVPDHLEQKFKRKAESAVNEVLAIKKIKPKDLAKFIVTHKKELKQYLNNPKADQEKACARLLLHKSLQEKYRFIRGRFSNMPIEDLFMSRQERRKLKKEAIEKKKKGKNNKVVNSEGDWDVEDVEIGEDSKLSNESDISDDELSNDKEKASDNGSNLSSADEKDCDADGNDISMVDSDSGDSDQRSEIANPKAKQNNSMEKINMVESIKPIAHIPIKRHEKNVMKKDNKKNKNLNEKLLSRKFKKDTEGLQVSEAKIVDPFFITSTGENYMSVAEPRQPDEVKEIHKEGNRKLRRAAMFGHVPKIKPRRDNYFPDNKNFNKQNGFEKSNRFSNNFNKQSDDGRNSFKDGKYNNNNQHGKSNVANSKLQYNKIADEIPEKLHPSWEAKKKKSGILPFQGKKIVFDN
ncbi:phosphatidylinositol 4-phosphate 5-kinase [Plodia interpunctella]|uniref:phosphatidylinositol 4-phosphate 5-kinase n=1 Tax=Plodia interpunctella TaxID=58824 RepID=UPI002368378E|nr:phosphatidylinositol 4-phosphate 5-kinase [Plodia interpunctella]